MNRQPALTRIAERAAAQLAAVFEAAVEIADDMGSESMIRRRRRGLPDR